jgi:hypothetical protein
MLLCAFFYSPRGCSLKRPRPLDNNTNNKKKTDAPFWTTSRKGARRARFVYSLLHAFVCFLGGGARRAMQHRYHNPPRTPRQTPNQNNKTGHLRVGAYLARFAAGLDFEPALVNVKRLAGGRHLVEITGTVRARPHRTWLLLPTLLLPASIPVRATIKAGVAGGLDDGKIDLLWGRWHNLPPLPSPARLFNGLVFGAVPHALEPAWGRAMEFFGDDFYKRKVW